MAQSPRILGIDGGGTSTTAWLADAAGHVLGRGRAGPANAKAIGNEAARAAINQAIEACFRDAGCERTSVAVACLGMAGSDRPEDGRLLDSWAEADAWAHRRVLVNDGDLVLAAGTPEGWGIGLIAGTGSIAVGRAPDGRTARAGGWGYLFGDEGSAYAVAIAALRWVARHWDGREPRPEVDPLTARVCAFFDVDNPARLVPAVYRPDIDRTRIAALAPVVVAAAKADSCAAAAILNQAADDLADAVLAVARSLHLLDAAGPLTIPLALAGGFLLATPGLDRVIVARCCQKGMRASPVTPVPEPVVGALRIACDALSK